MSQPTPQNSGLTPFNRTGRDDTTTEVLKPTVDAATKQRNATIIAVVIVAFLIASYFVFLRSGLDFNTVVNDPGRGFGQGHAEQNIEQSNKGE